MIVNLNVKDAWHAGLFGWIQNGATVKNLVIRNASVSSVSQDSESVSPHNPQAYPESWLPTVQPVAPFPTAR